MCSGIDLKLSTLPFLNSLTVVNTAMPKYYLNPSKFLNCKLLVVQEIKQQNKQILIARLEKSASSKMPGKSLA